MRVRAVIAAAILAALAPAASADAARLVRFTTHSRFVNGTDPNIPFNTVHRADLPSARKLPVNVLLPDGYDGKRRFPVLYLLHGHGDTYDSWMDPNDGDLAHLAAGLPAIVVMPEGGRGWYTNWWNGGRRGNPAWERYHLDELIPLIRQKFRIKSGRRWHAIAGLSMGGEGAMFYAEQRPGYFGSVASFSGVLSIQRPEWPDGFNTQGEKYEQVYGDPNAQSFYWQGHNPTTLVDNLRHTRVFVAVGDGTPNPSRPDEVQNTFGQVAEAELRQHANDFVSAARAAGVHVTYDPRHGIHDWPYWRQHLTDAMHWGLWGKVVSHPSSWTFSTVAAHSRTWGFTFTFPRAPAAFETFKLSGNRLTGTGAGTVRIRTPRGRALTRKLPFGLTLPKR